MLQGGDVDTLLYRPSKKSNTTNMHSLGILVITSLYPQQRHFFVLVRLETIVIPDLPMITLYRQRRRLAEMMASSIVICWWVASVMYHNLVGI